jgi:guanylate kinase
MGAETQGGAAKLSGPEIAPLPGRLSVMTGPSGVGKGTLIAALRQRHPSLWLSVSATTRAPRSGEREGEHYFFLTRQRFEQLVQRDGLLEWAEFAGNLYGTPRLPVEQHLALGQPVLLEIELEGARQVRRSFPAGFQLLIKPPSFAELERRIRGRGTDSDAAIERRLARARLELEAEPEFDAVLVNGDLEGAVAELEVLLGLVPLGGAKKSGLEGRLNNEGKEP